MPKILDACCGSRMFWFDRNNPDVIFADNRTLETTLCDGRTLVIEPDMIIDFRDMPFEDNTFQNMPTAFEDGKGIIVMDNPKNCGECKLFRHLTGFAQTCGYYNCNTDSQLKPSWCPINPITGRTEKSDG